jgi:hypothetical protein
MPAGYVKSVIARSKGSDLIQFSQPDIAEADLAGGA